MDSSPPLPQSRGRSWSIHGRTEITSRYEILHRVGSGAYSDVYRARRKSDGLPVALKEIHDYQSAFREIEALQLLRNAPNVVHLIEYFWQDDENEDAVLVLEFLESDLASVVKDGRKREGGISVGEVKAWMLQILRGVDACHQNGVVHRDLKPLNLLISGEGVLKLADFGQSRILQEQRYISEEKSIEHGASRDAWTALQELQHPHSDVNSSWPEGTRNQDTSEVACEEDCYEEVDGLKAKYAMDDTVSWKDGEASCVATCCTTDVEDDPLKGHEIFEPYEGKEADDSGELTSCVGTRWYRAPELLYGSTSYAHEIDLWSLGCIFAELLNLQPLFPGISDIDQLARIINTLGNATEETWIGCSKLPDYGKISFNKIDNPLGLESHLPNRSSLEVSIVKRLLCYNPINRASAKELLQERYFTEEPLPDPLSELKVPVKSDEQDDSLGDWHDGSESDTEWFGNMDISKNEKGFSIQFL